MDRNPRAAILSLVVVGAILLAACAGTGTAIISGADADAQATAATPASARPPGGVPAGPPPGTGSGGADAEEGLASATGAYTLDGEASIEAGLSINAPAADQSGVYVIHGGSLTLSESSIITGGNTSSDENSSFYGLNAAVLAASGSTVDLSDSSIATTGTGANGAFATGSGSSVSQNNVTIAATGDGAHGVMATQGGSMTLTDVDITTSGAHSAPIATDRGGGTITVSGGSVMTSGQDSPCYYSTGAIAVDASRCEATGSESAVIEGSNSIVLTNTAVQSSVEDKWGVMIYQSFSGDAEGAEGVFTMTGGSLADTALHGPLFYVTNSTGTITLTGVDVATASGTLVLAAANERWGTSGANGGTAILMASRQALEGDVAADGLSSITVTLQAGSTWTGSLNADAAAKEANLVLDESSVWTVTADSYLTSLSGLDPARGSTIANIIGNGFTVSYDSAACPALEGQTYLLSGGGFLRPAG